MAGEQLVGVEAEALQHAGPVALEEHVGTLQQPVHEVDAARVLEVDGDRASAAVEHRVGRRALTDPVHPDDLGPEVGQQHRGEGPWTDAAQLEHPHPGQGT